VGHNASQLMMRLKEMAKRRKLYDAFVAWFMYASECRDA
jgi:hypothetical protein